MIGVIIGALLSGSLSLLTARRSDKQQARGVARLLESELRSVAQDLYLAQLALQMRDNSTDLRTLFHLSPTTAWDAHRSLLASLLTTEEWYAVARAYESIDLLRGAASTNSLYVNEGRRLYHTAIAEVLIDLIAHVQAGAGAVSRLAGNPNPDPSPPVLRDYLAKAMKASQRSSSTSGASSTND